MCRMITPGFQFNMPLVFRTADALDAGLHLSTFHSLAQVDALARLAAVLVHFVAIVTLLLTVRVLALEY